MGGDTRVIDSESFMFLSFEPVNCCQISENFLFSSVPHRAGGCQLYCPAHLCAVTQYLPCFCGSSASGWHHFGNHRLVTALDISVTGYTYERKDSAAAFASGGESPKLLDVFSKPSFLPSCLCGSQHFWFDDHSWLHQHPQLQTETGSLASSLLALDWRTQLKPSQ